MLHSVVTYLFIISENLKINLNVFPELGCMHTFSFSCLTWHAGIAKTYLKGCVRNSLTDGHPLHLNDSFMPLAEAVSFSVYM